MRREVLILATAIFVFGLFVLTSFYPWGSQAQINQLSSGNTPVPTPEVCVNHGGVNCSIINPEFSVTCNDGTTDNSFVIYAVKECQKNLDDLAQKEADFMARSGCFPPSEMGCFNEQSYKNLSWILASSGLANSELGKSELAQCRQQIKDYQIKNNDYKQCLSANGNPQFALTGDVMVKPLLKAVFCSLFYGDKATYDDEADLCVCDKGYFMFNSKCEEASLICQVKYGPDAFSKNGNCYQPPVKPKSTIVFTPSFTSPNPYSTQPRISPTLSINSPQPTSSMTSQPIQAPYLDRVKTSETIANTNQNLITKVFTAILLGMKKILKLF